MMKYTCSVEINRPIDEVVKLWQDEKHFKDWQDGFRSIEHLSGKRGEVGAKSRILLDSPQGEMELMETLLKVNLPEEKTGLYEHKHMTNTQTSRFHAIETNRTRYTSEVEYTQFNGFMIKAIAKLFPSKFKAQSQKWMNQFKVLVEREGQ